MNAKFLLAIALAAGLLAAACSPVGWDFLEAEIGDIKIAKLWGNLAFLPHIFHAGEGGVEAFVSG